MLRFHKGVWRMFSGKKQKERGQGAAGSSADMPAQAAVGWSPCPCPHTGHGGQSTARRGWCPAVPPQSGAEPSSPHREHGTGNSRACRDGFWFFPKDEGG